MPVIVKFDGKAVLALHPFRQPFDRRLEAQFIENRRAEFKCQRLRIRDRLIDKIANCLKRVLIDRRQARFLQTTDFHLAEGKRLPDHIMEVGRHSAPLAFFGERKLGGKRAKLALRLFTFGDIKRSRKPDRISLELNPPRAAVHPPLTSSLCDNSDLVAPEHGDGSCRRKLLAPEQCMVVGVDEIKIAHSQKFRLPETGKVLSARIYKQQIKILENENGR